MASKNPKKRCIIQKLDFENCIITNIKTTTRGRKKLRARITREIETISEIPEKPLNSSPESNQQAPEPTSPVLIRKQCNRESPVFFKRKKNTPEKTVEELSSTIEVIPSSPGSPVFKSFKKQKRDKLKQGQEFQSVMGRLTSLDMLNSQGSSDMHSSYLIEDCTQESKQSVKISSVESTDVQRDNHCVYSIDADSGSSSEIPAQHSGRLRFSEKLENLKSSKKNYKKNSLLGRLHKLQQKQASDKLLWQHQNRKKSASSLKVSINNFWREDFNYFMKCQSDLESMLLIVDSRWVPNIKAVKEGSVLLLHPPWQKVALEKSAMTVFLNLICLDVLEETEEPVFLKRTVQSVPTNLFEDNQKLFLDSLFSYDPGFFF